MLGATSSGTTVRAKHDAPEDVPPLEHDQRFWLGEMRVHASYGLTSSLAFDLQVPFRVTNTHVKFHRLDGGPLDPDYDSIHHRNETLRGIGDPRIGAKAGRRLAGIDTMLLAGLSVPLGRTEPNPFALGDAGIRHQHIQFGTGTFDPFVDFGARTKAGSLSIAANAGALLPWLDNEHGYRAGTRFNAGLQASFPWKRLEPGVRVDASHEEPEHWDGAIEQEGNLGRTDVLLGVVVGSSAGPYRLSFEAGVPVWQRIAGGQLEYPAVLSVGVSRGFGSRSPRSASPD